MVYTRPWLPRALVLVTAVALAGCSSAGAEKPKDTSTSAQAGAGGTSAGGSAGSAATDTGKGWPITAEQDRGSRGIEGYANRVSVLPGEEVTLFVSSPTPTYRVEAYRMSGRAPSGAQRVWRSQTLKGAQQRATATDPATQAVSARWKPSLTVSTEGWSEGMYLFRLAAKDGSASYVPLVVRSASTKGKVVLVSSVTTWQAYNLWGGRSAYKDDEGSFSGRSRAVSFDRPNSKGKGTGGYLSYENPAVLLAEKLRLPLAYATSVDIATIPGYLDGALGYVSFGHDEYWTGSERDAVEAARDAGTNLAFLGANVSYWQVRLRDTATGPHRLMEIYKDGQADPASGKASTIRYRDLGRGENTMTGMLYECFPATGDYTVLKPDFFLFQGTGATKGSTYADIIAVEVDRAYPLATTPRPLEVVALSPTKCGDARTVSTSTYYTAPSGAGVFSVGSIGWIFRGMSRKATPRTADFVRKVTTNLLKEMAQGPMGQRHPATDNLDRLGLKKINTTGSA